MKIPMMFELSGKKVLIIGGGKTSYRLTIRLKQFFASITLVSKVFDPRFAELKSVKCIEDIIRHNAINEEYFEDVGIVIAASNNIILNEKIYKYCKENRILCMTTHRNGPKDFDFMETEEKNGLILAASIDGANPAFSSEIIHKFMASIDEETFKRLEMILEEQSLIASLVKKK